MLKLRNAIPFATCSLITSVQRSYLIPKIIAKELPQTCGNDTAYSMHDAALALRRA